MSTRAWLDQILAVPTAGIQISPKFKAAGNILSAVGPVMDSVFQSEGEINVESSSLLDLKFSSKGGISYSFSPTDFVVAFNYAKRPKKEGGSLSAYEYGEVEPYTLLLDKVLTSLQNVFQALSSSELIEMQRIGIVATTRIARKAIPPGLDLLMEHLGRPWGTALTKINSLLLAKISEGEGVMDRCHHTVIFDATQVPQEVQFALDWQRVFSGGVRYDPRRFNSVIQECKEKALLYFQKVGEGELNYADQ